MVREIRLTELRECKDKDWLGKYSKPEDYDEVINEDANIYLPDGKLVLVYRKAAIKTLVNIPEERYEYWKWVSLDTHSTNRGNAAGSELIDGCETRLTNSQRSFFGYAQKGTYNDFTEEQVREVLEKDTRWNVYHYLPKWIKEDGLVDLEVVEPLEEKFKDRTLNSTERKQVEADLIRERGKWFDNWVFGVWLKADDRKAEAKRAWKRYVGSQSFNRCQSNVVGAIDRQALVPWARLTATTQKNWAGFENEKPFFQEVDALFKETMPEYHEFLYNRFQEVKDPRFNLFDTAFTTVTINNNFRTAYHRDKLNCKGGMAVLSSINRGSYTGFGLVFPQMRLAFDIRDGDFLCGDNQGYIHGQLPMEDASPDAESIWFVFYSKERLRFVDDLDCEMCRKSFKRYAAENHRDKGTGRPGWSGIWAEMWKSPEWDAYKAVHCPNASNNNWTMT